MTARTATDRESVVEGLPFAGVARRLAIAVMATLAFVSATVDTGTAVTDFVEAAGADRPAGG